VRFLVGQPGPYFSVQDVYTGWSEALAAAGHDVFGYNLGDRLTFYYSALRQTDDGLFRHMLTGEQAKELAVNGLYAALMKVRPHVLLLVSGFYIPPELVDIARSAGVRVVLLCTESPYEDAKQAELAKHCDLTLVDDPTNLHLFPAGTEYMPKAYRPAIHHPGPPVPDLVRDFAFVGSAYPSRIAFFEAMDLDGLSVLLGGNWRLTLDGSPLREHLAHDVQDCMDNTETADVYRSARVGLNLYRREAESDDMVAGWSMGPREVEMAACGLFFLRDPRGEGDELLDMLPTFTSPAEASEQLRWWLARPDARAAAAEKARAAVADRTFDNHARRLLRLLEKG
jgi:spore maturation protein CgeB